MKKLILIGLLLFCGSSLFASPTGLYDVVWWKWFKTNDCRFTPDDSKIYVNSDEGVGIFDTKTGNQDTLIEGVWFGLQSYDCTKYYKVENGVIKEYDFLNLKHIRDFKMNSFQITTMYVTNSKYITARNLGGMGFSIWDIETGTYLDSMHLGMEDKDNRITEAVREVFVTPDFQKIIARLDKWQNPIKQSDPQTTIREHIKIFDFQTKAIIKEIESIGQLYLSKTGKYFVCENPPNDGKTALKVFNIEGDFLFSIPGWTESISDIDFSSDDKFMLVSFKTGGKKIEIWDLEKYILNNTLTIGDTPSTAMPFFSLDLSKNNLNLIASAQTRLYMFENVISLSNINNKEITTTITYPNPSTTELVLEFTLIQPNNTTITINDLSGKQIKEVLNSFLNEGNHKLHIDLRELPVGSYILNIQSGKSISSNKILIIK